MPDLRKLFATYSGQLRDYKLFYILYNLLNIHKLWHNRKLYRQLGIAKSILAPVCARDIQNPSHEVPWLDSPTALQQLYLSSYYQSLDVELQQQLKQWVEEGYLVLRQYFEVEIIAKALKEVETLLTQKKIKYNYTGKKIMDAHLKSSALNNILHYPPLIELLSFILGKPVWLFQSIFFTHGSEQKPHSDFIHMSTEPKGYLIAIWVALEDVQPEAGPLCYYPKSHRLPYIMNDAFETGNNWWRIGAKSYARYEEKIQQIIAEYELTPSVFCAQRGDVLIWHANLLHAGAPIQNSALTRKSLVGHYFAKDVFCYHEITERPAISSL
ncbi:MAG: phytanoyl-CoA dioxygenase family protein [Bacteroidia bacterium]|nr:phytanoyl-CoA dioxygenase family protein [Bacteroidia bacterium]MDW8159251.1 phytanoyl-CoA dioxygenase family protein [Bacteroidia bacterium]